MTNRYHHYLVDIQDATPEMIRRAEVEKDVIITDYIRERWDAPPIKGIKSIYSLIAKKDGENVYLHSREHACSCANRMKDIFEECIHVDISGPLRKELSTKLPYKEVLKRNLVHEELQRINFFKGPLPLNTTKQIVIAIRRDKVDVNDEPFLLGLMTKKIKVSTTDIEFEYTISGVKNKVVIKKGTYCVTYKLLYSVNLIENIYHIPLKAKEMKIPLSDIYNPDEENEVDRENYLTCTMHSVVDDRNQNEITYVIDSTSIEKLRNTMTICL